MESFYSVLGAEGNWKPGFHQLLKTWGFFRLEKRKLEDKG